MKIIIYLILSIIGSITNILPLSYSSHITLFKNLLNTKIFNNPKINSLFILPSLIAILITIIKYLPTKKNKQNKTKYLKTFFIFIPTIIISLITNIIFKPYPSLKTIPYLFLITSITLLITKNKPYNKTIYDLKYSNIIFLNLFNIFSLLTNLPSFLFNLVSCYLCKLSKESSIKYSFIIYFFNLLPSSFNGLNYLFSSSDIFYLLISITISTIISLSLIKYLINLIKQNQLKRLALYLLLLAIFTFIWFR